MKKKPYIFHYQKVFGKLSECCSGPICLNALEMAVTEGNIALTKYIAKNEPHLLSCSTSWFGLSPLIRAMLLTDHVLSLKMVQILIATGANCNLKTAQPEPKALEGCRFKEYPKGATPLVVALEKTRNWSLLMFLVGKKDCMIEYVKTENGKQILCSELSGDTKDVYQGLQGCRLFLLSKYDANNEIDLNQCPDLIHSIVFKVFDMIKDIPMTPDKPLIIPTRAIPTNSDFLFIQPKIIEGNSA